MLIALYIILGLLALAFCVFGILFFAPVKLKLRLADGEFLARVTFLGFWAEKTPGENCSGFLRWQKKPKKEKPEELEKTPEAEKKAERKKKKKKEKKPKGKVPATFWLKRRKVLIRSLAVLFRMITEIITSVRLFRISGSVCIGNGDPARAGTVYGWLIAFRSWLPEDAPFSVYYDFDPLAEWHYNGEIVLSDNIWRAIIAPVLRALWRLPKIELFRVFRAYKKATKIPEEKKVKTEETELQAA